VDWVRLPLSDGVSFFTNENAVIDLVGGPDFIYHALIQVIGADIP